MRLECSKPPVQGGFLFRFVERFLCIFEGVIFDCLSRASLFVRGLVRQSGDSWRADESLRWSREEGLLPQPRLWFEGFVAFRSPSLRCKKLRSGGINQIWASCCTTFPISGSVRPSGAPPLARSGKGLGRNVCQEFESFTERHSFADTFTDSGWPSLLESMLRFGL